MSQVNTDLVADRLGTGPANLFKQWAAKAWANLDGTTGTPSIVKSENISSVTDNGTGDYSFNLINSMAGVDDWVAFAAMEGSAGNQYSCTEITTARKTASAIPINTTYNGNLTDSTVHMQTLGDLA